MNPIILPQVFAERVICSSYYKLATVNVTNLCNYTSVLAFQKSNFSTYQTPIRLKTVASLMLITDAIEFLEVHI